MSTSIIINPGAGSVGDLDSLKESLELLGDVHFLETCSSEHAEQCAARASANGFERIIAAGGDGTVNSVLNGLVQERGIAGLRDIELGVLPLGTGNDFANSIGMKLPLNEAIDALLVWDARPVDVVQLDAEDEHGGRVSRLFLNASAGGFVKNVGESTDSALKRTGLGGLSYALTAAASLEDVDHYQLDAEVDGEKLDSRVMAVIVANGRTIGGGLEVAPDAELDDGLVELLMVPEGTLPEMLFAAVEAVTGSAGAEGGMIQRRRGREIRLESRPRMPLSVDGEEVGWTPGVFSVVAGGIRVVRGG